MRIKELMFSVGDVLLTIVGTIGRSLVVNKTHPKFTLQRSVAVLKPKLERVNPSYLSRVIQNGYFKDLLNSRAKGVAQKGIYLKELSELQIPLPPLSTQEEIVAEIEGYQKIIDGAKAVVANYKPKIDMGPDWEMVELGEVCEHITKGTTPTTNGYKWQETGINFIKIENINTDGTISDAKMAFIDEKCHESLKRSQLQKDDILFSIAGTKMGITGIVTENLLPANTNQALAIIRSKGEFEPSFLLHYLMSENIQTEIERLKVGVAQFNLSLKQVSELQIPNVEKETQRQIVAQIEKEQALVNPNKQLIEIFEQKIKDRIVKVWGE